jgi:LacI family transcriptional regulator
LRVPDDVSLVTYGNISNPWMFYCRLTHIPQDGIRIGKKTGEVILDMLSGENPPHVKEHILYTDVVFGDSVKVLNI